LFHSFFSTVMNTTMTRLHRLSGIVVASFLLLHVTNHLFALGGPEWHIAVTNLFRHIYRSLLVEVVLLMCVIFQIISGIVLVFKKGFLRQPFYVLIQIISGLYLSFFMIYHVWAVMLGRYTWNVNTDFYFAATVANQYPEKLFFIPYYTLSLISVFAHIACAHYLKRMERLNKFSDSVRTETYRRKYKKEVAGICITGAVITFLIMIAISGVLYDISETTR
jgi:succinate dehydrogenase/fumarate reductase cytochrome b subunit